MVLISRTLLWLRIAIKRNIKVRLFVLRVTKREQESDCDDDKTVHVSKINAYSVSIKHYNREKIDSIKTVSILFLLCDCWKLHEDRNHGQTKDLEVLHFKRDPCKSYSNQLVVKLRLRRNSCQSLLGKPYRLTCWHFYILKRYSCDIMFIKIWLQIINKT